MAEFSVCRCGRPRNRDGGPHLVVALLAVRHHDVQAVGRAALEDGDQNLLARGRRVGRVESALAARRARCPRPPSPGPRSARRFCASTWYLYLLLEIRRAEEQAGNDQWLRYRPWRAAGPCEPAFPCVLAPPFVERCRYCRRKRRSIGPMARSVPRRSRRAPHRTDRSASKPWRSGPGSCSFTEARRHPP